MPKLGPKVVWKCDVCGREAEAYGDELPRVGKRFKQNFVWRRFGEAVACLQCAKAAEGGFSLLTQEVDAPDWDMMIGDSVRETVARLRMFAQFYPTELVDDGYRLAPRVDFGSIAGEYAPDGGWAVARWSEKPLSDEEKCAQCGAEVETAPAIRVKCKDHGEHILYRMQSTAPTDEPQEKSE